MLKRIVNIIIFTLACIVATDASPSCEQYRAVTSPTAGGTIIARTNGGCKWSLRAVPEPGYEFSQWSDGNTDNPRHVTIATPGDPLTFTAEFVTASFTMSLHGEEFGTVSAEQSDECLNKWELTPEPNSGYTFTRWSDGNTDDPRTVSLDPTSYVPQSFYAIFTENWCGAKAVTYGPSADGTGSVTATHCNCEWYFTATPTSGYKFVGWTDGSTDNPRVVELTDPSGTYEYRALFTSNSVCDFDTCKIDHGHGYITATKESDCTWNLRAHAKTGWEFTEWNDGNTSNPREVTLDGLQTRIDYTATFTYVACKPYRAVLDAQNGGSISASKIDCEWTLTATPNDGYEFISWSDGSLDNPHVIYVDNPSVDLTYRANFRQLSCHYSTAEIDEGKGKISVTKQDCDPCTYRLTAEGANGWEFSKWSDNSSTINPRDVTIDVNEVDYVAYSAEFIDSYCANVRDVHTDCAGGTIVATRRNGCEWVLTAVPASSYEFKCWSDGKIGNPRIINFSRESTSSYSLSANFAPCIYETRVGGDTIFGKVTAIKDKDGDGCSWILTATAESGWEFDHWDDAATENPHTIVTDGDPREVSAVFHGLWNNNFHAVVSNPAGGGTVTAVNCNYTWTLTATPDEANGYQFVAWEDGSVANPRTIEINPAVKVHNYRASFMIPDSRIDGWAYNGLEITSHSTDIFDGGSTGRANIYINGVEVATSVTVTEKDHGRWFVAFNPSLLSGHVKDTLQVRVYDECDQLSCAIDTIVPVVITGNTLFSTLSIDEKVDVQVVRGVLSIDRDVTFRELDIYGNAQVSLPSGKSMTVDRIYMRADGPMAEYPKFSVNGSVTNANSNIIYYDYTLDYHKYYPLALPYTVACNQIRTKTNHTPMYQAYWYNSDDRAMNESGWTEYDDTADGAEITQYQGYSIFAVPEEWNSQMQSTVVLRFPMVADLSSGEPEKSVPVSLYNYEGVTNESNRNWNLIGNPYLTDYSPSNNENLMEIKYYVPNPSGQGYSESETGEKLRYLTWSVDGNRTYIQNRITETSMSAFRPYFVQAKVAGDLVFSLSRRANAPRRPWMTNEPEEEVAIEYELGVVLSGDSLSDRTGLLYGELFTQGYEMNADLVKMFGSNQPMSLYSIGANGEPRAYNALPAAEAAHPVPLGYRNAPEGTMQIAFDTAHYDASLFEAVYLLDYETGNTTNLLDEPYIFRNTQNSSDTRFALFAALSTKPHTPTGTDVVSRDAQGIEVYDMLGRRVSISFDDLPQGVYVVVQDGEPRKEVVK